VNVLLDEGVPSIIQKLLSNFSISTVEEMGWRAVENGALLDLMAPTFQTLITTDKNLIHQQNFNKRGISAIILPTNQIPLVRNMVSKIEETLISIGRGEVVEISIPSSKAPD
jgi:hypothetical protein